MNDLIVKEFNGIEIHTFWWNGKPSWIANEIVSPFNYTDPSKTIQDCIIAEEFELGIEYEVLRGEELKAFKEMVNSVTTFNVVSPNTPNLTIFYEDGLYGFLEYTKKPLGVQFRKFIRREVLPEIRQTGAYITNRANPEMLRQKADEIEITKVLIQKQRAEAMLLNARTRQAKLILEMQKNNTFSPVAVELLGVNALEVLTGQTTEYRPQIEKTYTATEIAQELGVTANKLGRIANANNLKTDEFGITVLDKSPHCDKQVASFRYNEKGRVRLHELIRKERG